MSPPRPPFLESGRLLALLLGLHGLGFLVVFPLGPQETRLWHPGVPGVALLAAAYPLAATIGGLLARRSFRLPSRPSTLVALALLGTLPCALSFDYPTLLAARLGAGLLAGLSFVAIHRVLPESAAPSVSRLAPRIVAFGMPLCLLCAALADWRFAFAPILAGQAALLLAVALRPGENLKPRAIALHEPAPLALLATGALAAVGAAYLTVLSGFLVFNAGHTELHIPACLLLGALFGLCIPPLFVAARRRLEPGALYSAALAASALSLLSLLLMRAPLPAAVAVPLVGMFLATNAARHQGLVGLVLPLLPGGAASAHQLHTHLAHHLGSGLGALLAGLLVTRSPRLTLVGMPLLLGACLLLSGLALVAGLLAARRLSTASSGRSKAMPTPLGPKPETIRSAA